MEVQLDELDVQWISSYGPLEIDHSRFYFPTNPLNDPFLPPSEEGFNHIPRVCLFDFFSSAPRPSPQESSSAQSDDSSDSFTFQSPFMESPKNSPRNPPILEKRTGPFVREHDQNNPDFLIPLYKLGQENEMLCPRHLSPPLTFPLGSGCTSSNFEIGSTSYPSSPLMGLKNGLGRNNKKARGGSEDSFYSADSDFSSGGSPNMDIDGPSGPLRGEGGLINPLRFKRNKARVKKQKKALEQIKKERDLRNKKNGKKKLGWVGNFWAKLKISKEKRTQEIVQVGGKLETIEEVVEEEGPTKKRCKLQKLYQGKMKFKYGLSEEDSLKSSSDEAVIKKGVVAGPMQPPTEL
ncbi:hypothetical protein BVRB_4g095300 [Beta vulgaris subsp. vulgaris]|uniref:Uncharacterized protein n=1 Tax=Beta vulgaris subsp. vulgaris TaxID=3555 RepID=A0A0J8BDK0_BETVV|nr:hypothetical protein BVRB_4g095300 [Beta vulgaris subsp. vulgaris]